MGTQNGTASVENILAVTQQVKHRLAILPGNSTPRYIMKRVEKEGTKKQVNWATQKQRADNVSRSKKWSTLLNTFYR